MDIPNPAHPFILIQTMASGAEGLTGEGGYTLAV